MGGNHSHGSMAEEALRLVDAIQQRILSAPRSLGASEVWHEVTDHIATGSPECRVCPVCRVIAAWRSAGPEVRDRLAEAGEAVLTAIREAVAAYERAGGARRPGADVEHINLGR